MKGPEAVNPGWNLGKGKGGNRGGGVGLVAVCDIAIAARDAKFGLSEVKLGILPAVISPYDLLKRSRWMAGSVMEIVFGRAKLS